MAPASAISSPPAAIQIGPTLPHDFYTSAESIYALLEPAGPMAAVRLWDSKWLLQRAALLEHAVNNGEDPTKYALPHRQALERDHPNAFLDPALLRKLTSGLGIMSSVLPVGSVSHAWMGSAHPDPKGEQLLALGDMIRRAQHKQLPCQKGVNGFKKLPPRFGIFYDFSCLNQAEKTPDGGVTKPRTPGEAAAFDHALKSMQLWYAHDKIFTFLMTRLPDSCTALPYAARGWPTCERQWAMLAKPNDNGEPPMIFDNAAPDGLARRLVPMTAESMDAMLEQRTFTSVTLPPAGAQAHFPVRAHTQAHSQVHPFASSTVRSTHCLLMLDRRSCTCAGSERSTCPS